MNLYEIFQFQYFEKDEFEALKNLRRLNLDRNHLVVIVDKLFSSQKSLEFLGESDKLNYCKS